MHSCIATASWLHDSLATMRVWTLSEMMSKNKNGGDSWGTLYGKPLERLAFRYDRHEEIARYIWMWHVRILSSNGNCVPLKIFGCFCYSRCHRVQFNT